jgi:hypothetical protein
MKAAPIRVLKSEWSRKLLKVCTNGASSEPEVALEIAQVGPVGKITVDLAVVELLLVLVRVVTF